MVIMLSFPNLNDDRRTRRSDDPSLAIGFQLEQVVRDFGLDCCVLVDEGGQVIALSPDSPTPLMEGLARLAPMMAMAPEHRGSHMAPLRRHRPDLGIDEVTCCVFRAGGRRMFIAAVGKEAVMNEVAIMRAISGTRRIKG